jgi:formylglycine-generating enzyme required for sulfatase activity
MRYPMMVLLLVAFCLTAPSGVALGQAADGGLLERYSGLLSQLRAELTEKLPRIGDEQRVRELLASDALDAKLVTFVVLHEGTPEGLAAFARQGKEQEKLIDDLLSDPKLMKQMLVSDGALDGKYGQAMTIYTGIQRASEKAKDGILQRLAMAIALEYAAPKWNHDPVKRHLHFEKAYLDGELDPGFPTLDTWNLRSVVDGNEPDWMLAWGREMLRNYRPDHIHTENRGWRYSSIVKTNVHYGSGRVGQDRPELHSYQNILMNGGVCGRRAFFGQYILRCFGNPVIKRPSRGHGALARWTPNGWAVNLGPGWGSGWTDTIYKQDRAFLASSQARRNPEAYLQVKRAMWIGDVLGEKRQYGGEAKTDTWNGVSLLAQQRIIKESKAVTLAPLGEEFGEADEPTVAEKVIASPAGEEDTKIIYGGDGSIEIPAAAFSTPQKELKGVAVMRSFAGGTQIYLPNFGRKGSNVYRGGGWKSGVNECSSERRIRDAGLGGYPNWGFRAAMAAASGESPPEMTLDLGNGVTMEFVYIQPGTFEMGGESTSEGKFDCVETPKHKVEITKGYYLGKHEVTRAQFAAAFSTGDGKETKDADHPQGGVRFDGAERFCKKISERTGRNVRLPTEAEWEYAARAGTDGRWFFGDDPAKLGEFAWLSSNSGNKSNPVGQKKPNPWGLYDMHGNVWELVADVYEREYFANSPKKDPTGPSQDPKSCVEYTINVPQAGQYALTARVVTMNYEQVLNVATNDDAAAITMALPFTCGTWQDAEPAVLTLKAGQNILKFSRTNPPQYGIAVKSFMLKPLK